MLCFAAAVDELVKLAARNDRLRLRTSLFQARQTEVLHHDSASIALDKGHALGCGATMGGTPAAIASKNLFGAAKKIDSRSGS